MPYFRAFCLAIPPPASKYYNYYIPIPEYYNFVYIQSLDFLHKVVYQMGDIHPKEFQKYFLEVLFAM